MIRFIIKRLALLIIALIAITAIFYLIFFYFAPNPANCLLAKPVIYLYPEKSTDVSVKIQCDGKLTVTYPEYGNGWHVLAQPDGTLTDLKDGRQYSYLFWEARTSINYDFSEAFCVNGKDTAAFLRDALSQLGLTPREYNDFIVYWLPLMQGSKYNLISFQGKPYENAAKLDISPAPDSILRVFMAWKPLNAPITVKPQALDTFIRKGFTVVEWGGGMAAD